MYIDNSDVLYAVGLKTAQALRLYRTGSIAMVVFPGLPNVPTDLYDDKWIQCEWCWKWGMALWPPALPEDVLPLWDIDGLGYLCDNCFALEEPPWQPNARQRCAQALQWIMPENLKGSSVILATISTFIAQNDP